MLHKLFYSQVTSLKEINFPYLHPNIDLAIHLHLNDKLFTDEELEKEIFPWFQKNALDNRHKFSSNNGKRYNIVKLPDAAGPDKFRYLAIFLGKKHHLHLGEGCFGKIKLTQDMLSGEWFCIKDEMFSKENIHSFHREIAVLKKLNKLIASGARDNKKHLLIVLQLIMGMNLESFNENSPTLPLGKWLLILNNITKAASRLYQTDKLLHGDIKPGNFMINPRALYKITPIDFQYSLPAPRCQNINRFGSQGYMAYELLTSKTSVYNNEKTEMNALGLTLADTIMATQASCEVGGKIFAEPQRYRVTPFKKINPLTKEKISDETLLKELIEFYLLMTNDNADQRPTFEALDAFSSKIIREHQNEPSLHLKIGILDIDEFFANDEDKNAQLIAALKIMDTVWFVDKEKRPNRDYYVLGKLLEKNQVNVDISSKLFYSINLEKSIISSLSQIPEHILENPDEEYREFYHYFYVTAQKISSESATFLEKKGMIVIASTRAKDQLSEQINNHIMESLAPKSSVKKK